jgi:hypothetical protein
MEMESRHLAVMFIDWGAVLTSIGCSHSTIQQLVSISVAWYVDLYFTVFVPNKSLSFLLPFIVFLTTTGGISFSLSFLSYGGLLVSLRSSTSGASR